MPAGERGSLKAAFSQFKKAAADQKAELKLLGRTVEEEQGSQHPATSQLPDSYQASTNQLAEKASGLSPRPLLQREPVKQLSFRCPASLAADLRRRASFNQLEQQEIIVEGLKRVLAELPEPPTGWER